MKKILLLILISSLNLSQMYAQDKENINYELTVMSYNIRYDNPSDGVSSWDNRKEQVASLLVYYHPHIVGLQEALLHQIQYLDQELDDYKWIGVGRDDGIEKGEYSPVFYDSSKLELKEWGTFWLSEDPENPSTGWDAALPRICTWARFSIRSGQKEIYFFNTHFDHKGEEARFESSKLITSKIVEQKQVNQNKAILVGDFNQTPQSAGYKWITKELIDAHESSAMITYGPEGTFSGFKSGMEIGDRIDYIFVGKGVICEKFRTIIDSNGKYYPSDHLPVIAYLQL